MSEPVRVRMEGRSMHPACPVSYDQLRYLRLTYWGADQASHLGEMVVNSDVADTVVSVFRQLFEIRFPITRMTLVDDFGPGATAKDGADDFGSIEADNTSAFNCRVRTGSTTEYSQHSYGRAVDLNPLLNPYVAANGTTAHAASRRHLDRTVEAPGVLLATSKAVAIFKAAGWGWGGDWSGIKDYQHFSSTGH
ncbi:MAG: M15 family metallopeptidase [Acidimicrobiales bacterium]